MAKTRILLVDDDPNISQLVNLYLTKEGFEVTACMTGTEALRSFKSSPPNLMLLDVMLPGMDGWSVLREIRKFSNIPIIMITARCEDFERVMGLDIGADDYIVKPFSGEEVMARIRAILRRLDRSSGMGISRHQLTVGSLYIDMDNALVRINGQSVSLTKKELEILYTLAENSDKLYSRETLLGLLWGYDYYGDSRTVDSHVKRLRAKLDAFEHPDWQVKTIWGLGYKFEVTGHED